MNKKTSYFIILMLIMLPFSFADLDEDNSDSFQFNGTFYGETNVNININTTNRVYKYYDYTTYGSSYNSWDFYDDGGDVLEKAINQGVDNTYEYGFVNSLYRFIMAVLDPRITAIEKRLDDINKRLIDKEERIYTLQKRVKECEINK